MGYLLLLFFSLSGVIPVMGEGDGVVYERSNDSLTLQPAKIRDVYSAEVAFNIYQGLVDLDHRTLQVRPCLAEKWEILNDSKTWIFHLREGICFHNGREFSAEDVRYTFSHLITDRESSRKFYMVKNLIEGIRVMAPDRIEIRLNAPYAPFLTALTDPSFLIVPRGGYEQKPFLPVGTGPFAFQEWERGKVLILKKNPRFHDAPVRLENIIYRVQPDGYSRLLHIKNQDSDLLVIRSKAEEDTLASMPHIRIVKNQKLQINYLGFNLKTSAFADLRLRKAFARSINKEQLVRFVFQDLALPISAPLPPSVMDLREELGEDRYDIEAARGVFHQLLTPGERTFRLIYASGNHSLKELAGRLSANSARMGINLQVTGAPFPEVIRRIEKRDFDLFLLGYSSSPDPDLYLTPNFTPEGRFNHTGYENPKLGKLLDRARAEFDEDQRESLYQQALQFLHRDLPCIPLYSERCFVACNRRIENLQLHPFGIILFRDARIR